MVRRMKSAYKPRYRRRLYRKRRYGASYKRSTRARAGYYTFKHMSIVQTSLNLGGDALAGLLSGKYTGFQSLGNIPAGGGLVGFNQGARDVAYGPLYGAAAANVQQRLDANANPTTIGDGALAAISTRDSSIYFGRWDMSATLINLQYIVDSWARQNQPQAPAAHVPHLQTHFTLNQVMVQYIKVTCKSSLPNQPVYILRNASDAVPPRYIVGLGKAKVVAKPRIIPSTNNQGLRWAYGETIVVAPVCSHFQIKIRYRPLRVAA